MEGSGPNFGLHDESMSIILGSTTVTVSVSWSRIDWSRSKTDMNEGIWSSYNRRADVVYMVVTRIPSLRLGVADRDQQNTVSVARWATAVEGMRR